MNAFFANIKQWWRQIENGLLGTLSISAIIYAITTGTAEQFLSYGPATYGVIAVILNALGVFFLLQNRAHKPLTVPRVCKAAAFITVGAMPLSLLYYSLGAVLIDLLNFRSGQQHWSPSHMQAVTAALTVIVGVCFFWFRLRQRLLYGLSEALVGVAITIHRAGLEKAVAIPLDSSFYYAILTAGVYLLVRGLDNMHQAAKNGDWLFTRVAAFLAEPEKPKPRRLRHSGIHPPRKASARSG